MTVAKRDYYDILSVSKNASNSEIKQAYRKMALKYHPDRNKDKDAEAKFKEVNEAYEVLSDFNKKQAYDQFGHAAFAPAGFGGFEGGPSTRTYREGPFTYTYTTYGGGSPFDDLGFDFGGFSDPFEIFESFFGGASPFRRTARIPRYSLKLSFMEAVKGCEKTIVHRGKEWKIKIPAGVDDGTRIKFSDFYVSLDVMPDETFKREGFDVLVEKRIPFVLAALGGEVEVPTIDGNVKIKIRPGTQPGTLIRLKGRGIPRPNSAYKGDEYVRIIVQIPEGLSGQQRKILEEFEKVV